MVVSLPHTLLENIFSLIPYRHLLLVCSTVCKSWSHVILDSTYMPFRTLYHRLIWDSHTLFHSPLLSENGDLFLHNASDIVEQLCHIKYNITDGRYCMQGVLDMIEKKMKNWSGIGQEKKDSEIYELLSEHPLYASSVKAVTLKRNKVWSLVTAMAMLSRDTDEILQLLQVSLGVYPTATVMDIFYGYTVIFLFCSQRLHLSNIHHYKLHSALYQTENIILLQPEPIFCEQTLLINHVPSEGEIICVDYVPGVDISGVVLRMVQRHSTLRYLIVESQLSSLSLIQLPPNAVHSFSMCDSFIFDVLVLMPDSTDIEGNEWMKVKEISIITFRNVLSNEKKHCYNLMISVYPLMLSVKNQDLCWIIYSIMRHRMRPHFITNSNSYIPVSIEPYQQEENSCEDRALIIFSDFLSIYSFCYYYYLCNSSTDFLIITIDKKLEDFLAEVLVLYDYYGYGESEDDIWTAPPPFSFRQDHANAYSISGFRTFDFITWVKSKSIFNGEYHPSLNFIVYGEDMLSSFRDMPTFSLVRLYRGERNEIDMIAKIINNMKFDVLEIQLYNFFEEENINTFLGQQLATYNEINIRGMQHYCLYCSKSLKDEYVALKQRVSSTNMVAVRFTCFNSSDFICARCAISDAAYNIFDNLRYSNLE